MGATPIYKWPWTEDPIVADGPKAIGDLGKAIDAEFAKTDMLTYIPEWRSNGAYQPANPNVLVAKYRVANGWCDVHIFMSFGSAVFGGSGWLTLTVPVAAHPSLDEQYLLCKTWGPSMGQYHGTAYINGGTNLLRPEFTRSSTSTLLDFWKSTDDTGGPSKGVPLVSGGYPVASGNNFAISGRFKAA